MTIIFLKNLPMSLPLPEIFTFSYGFTLVLSVIFFQLAGLLLVFIFQKPMSNEILQLSFIW